MNLTHLVAFRFLRGASAAVAPVVSGEILTANVFIKQREVATANITQLKTATGNIVQLVTTTVER